MTQPERSLTETQLLALWEEARRKARVWCGTTLARLRRGGGGFYQEDDFWQDRVLGAGRGLVGDGGEPGGAMGVVAQAAVVRRVAGDPPGAAATVAWGGTGHRAGGAGIGARRGR